MTCEMKDMSITLTVRAPLEQYSSRITVICCCDVDSCDNRAGLFSLKWEHYWVNAIIFPATQLDIYLFPSFYGDDLMPFFMISNFLSSETV